MINNIFISLFISIIIYLIFFELFITPRVVLIQIYFGTVNIYRFLFKIKKCEKQKKLLSLVTTKTELFNSEVVHHNMHLSSLTKKLPNIFICESKYK